MNITILAVGRLKERYLLEAQQEYLKRLSAYARVNVVEVPDESVPEGAPAAVEERIKEKEAGRLSRHIQPGACVVALDREGGQMSSEEFAEFIADLGLRGKSQVAFVIGGTLGLSGEILARAQHRLSFSMMTFPHQLMRVILMEQVYRAFKIARGEPYHR
jgi:23S rRNA (pseudouridine1915-N3)-methyltransferase